MLTTWTTNSIKHSERTKSFWKSRRTQSMTQWTQSSFGNHNGHRVRLKGHRVLKRT